MNIFFIVYLIIGIILQRYEPISKLIEIRKNHFIMQYLLYDKQYSENKKNAIILFYRFLYLILYPLILISSFRKYVITKKTMKEEGAQYLYFSSMNGSGQLVCNNCNHQTEVCALLHFEENAIIGYQCQKCGKFHTRINNDTSTKLICQCGGTLSHVEAVFCDKCNSKDVKFLGEWMT